MSAFIAYDIITYWSHQAEEMFGWLRDEAIGQCLDGLIMPACFRKAHRKGQIVWRKIKNNCSTHQLIDKSRHPVQICF